MTRFSSIVTHEKPQKLEPAPGGKSGALLATYEGGVRAIIKQAKEKLPSGHSKQRGIPVSTHPFREAAFRRAADLIGCSDLVPETVLTMKAVPGIASAQLFVPAHHLNELQPKLKDVSDKRWGSLLAKTCEVVPADTWRKLLVLDILGGVRDRHVNNVGVIMRSEGGRPVYQAVAWDNAVSFGKTFDLYHNVFHKFLFRRSVDLGGAWKIVDKITKSDLHYALDEFLPRDFVDDAFKRVSFFRDFPYRLPFKVCSKGEDSPNEFPTYAHYFNPVVARPLHLVHVQA